MSTLLTPRGFRKSSAVITIAAANVAQNLYLRSAAGTVPRTVILRKIFAYSNIGNVTITIGIGLAPLVGIVPPFYVLNTFDMQLTEDEIPEIEVNANLTVQATVLGCLIMVEVEEVGS